MLTPGFLWGKTKNQRIPTMPPPDRIAPIHQCWPNGSAVFAVPDRAAERIELGRIVRENGGWHSWRHTPSGYRDQGLADSFSASLSTLGEPSTPEPKAAPEIIPARRRVKR